MQSNHYTVLLRKNGRYFFYDGLKKNMILVNKDYNLSPYKP